MPAFRIDGCASSTLSIILEYNGRMTSVSQPPYLLYFCPGSLRCRAISAMICSMQIGSEVAIHVHGADGSVGEVAGAGRVIHPRVVQVLPPLDEQLSKIARQAEEFVILADRDHHPVLRIRPGLVSYAEAAEMLAKEFPQVELAATETGIVVFETEEDIFDDVEGSFSSPWWCKVICLNSCSSC